MTQISRPQAERRDVYPDAGPYTAAEWAERARIWERGDDGDAGVCVPFGNALAASIVGGTISVATGAATVNGHTLINDAAVVITPTAANATYTVVAVQNSTAADYNTDLDLPAAYPAGIPAYSARVAILRGVGLVQTANQWMIPLASFDINLAGVLSNLVDLRIPTLTLSLYRNINGSLQADTGGNVRGANAVDLQQVRAAAAQVASGESALVAGRNNTASGTNAVAMGNTSTASGNNSVALGLANTASGLRAFAAGDTNVASGDDSVALGDGCTASAASAHAEGSNTVASGIAAHAEGLNATASGDYSHAEGSTTAASGDYSHAEGRLCSASGIYTHAGGYQSIATRPGESARASGYFAALGDAQTRVLTARRTTLGGGAATELFLDGDAITERIIIAENNAYAYEVHIVAISAAAGNVAAFRGYGLLYRAAAGNATLQSTTGVITEHASGGQTASITADAANQSLLILFNDNSTAAHRVVATVRLTQVAFP